MKHLSIVVVLLAALALAAGWAQANGGDDGKKIKIKLPLTSGGPTSDCPSFTINYRISSNGRSGSGTNCILGFNPVDCAPSLCVELPLLATFSLPRGTITARVTLFEKARCDPAISAKCTRVHHRWSGMVTEATGKFHELEGSTVSGGGVAVYRFPADPIEPFARLKHYEVLLGDWKRGE